MTCRASGDVQLMFWQSFANGESSSARVLHTQPEFWMGGRESAWNWLTSGNINAFYRPAAPHGLIQPITEVNKVGLCTKMADLIVCAPIRGHHRRQQEQSSHFYFCSLLVYSAFLVTSVHSIVTSAKRRIAFSGSLNTCAPPLRLIKAYARTPRPATYRSAATHNYDQPHPA